MGDPILVLSDLLARQERKPFFIVEDREAAAVHLSSGRLRAVCLDRGDPERALADARWLRRRRNRLPVLAWLATDQIKRIPELLEAGVEEILVRDSTTPQSALARLEQLDKPPEAGQLQGAEHLVAQSPVMRSCLELVEKAQRSDATVLLQGETGTGKEVLARVIHKGGARTKRPFIAINCAAFPETLLESELFGHERGAFTGARQTRRGHFEQADGGTLFLDEIGDTSPSFQVKLLRMLQEGSVRPLGANHEVRADVRIVAATNRDLRQAIEAGGFRRDLYYRLHVFPVAIPPLRVRMEDILPLARAFLRRNPCAQTLHEIAPDAARLLETHAWPGNVRELENEIARIVASHSEVSEITARMLSPEIRGLAPVLPPEPGSEQLRQTMARLEAWVLRGALEKHEGRRMATARSLGITRECLYKKLRRYGMQ